MAKDLLTKQTKSLKVAPPLISSPGNLNRHSDASSLRENVCDRGFGRVWSRCSAPCIPGPCETETNTVSWEFIVKLKYAEKEKGLGDPRLRRTHDRGPLSDPASMGPEFGRDF